MIDRNDLIAEMDKKGFSVGVDILEEFDTLIGLSTDRLLDRLHLWASEMSQLNHDNKIATGDIVFSVMKYYVQQLHAKHVLSRTDKSISRQGKISTRTKDSMEQKSLPPKYNSDSIRVKVGLGFTKNLGDFESFRSEAYAEDVCDRGEEKAAMDSLTELCSNHLEHVHQKYCPPVKEKEIDPGLELTEIVEHDISIPEESVEEINEEPKEKDLSSEALNRNIKPEYSEQVNEVVEKTKELFGEESEVEVVEDPKVLLDLKSELHRKIKLAAKSKELCYDLAIAVLKANTKSMTIAKVKQLISEVDSGNYTFFTGVSDAEAESELENK